MHAIFRRFVWTWERVWSTLAIWFETRAFHRLIAGAPALLLGVALIAIAFRDRLGNEPLLSHYNQLFLASLGDEQPAATELWARKLVQLDASASEAEFGQFWLAQKRGDTEAASDLLQQLAPDDKPGYPQAHLWRAKSLLQQGQKVAVDTTVVVHHLRQALAEPSQRQTAHELLAAIFIARRDYPAAIEQLEALVTRRPELRLQLSRLYALAGKPELARSEVQQALEFYRHAAEQRPADPKVQILWAQAEAAAGDLKRAEAILLAGVETADGAAFRKTLSSLYVSMANRLDQPEDAHMGERLQLFEQALRYTNDHPGALAGIGKLVQTDKAAEEARGLLQDALARGNAPALIHLLLGTAAAGENDWNAARQHLEQAYRLNPQAPALLNNLAWVLMNATPPQLDRALQLADAAIELDPKHPEIRETRGVILARMKRWSDALVDLELALAALPHRPRLHRTLAEAYTALGDDGLAARHQQLAEQPVAP